MSYMDQDKRQSIKSQTPGLTAEDKFILLCSRTRMQDSQFELAKKLAGDKLNWTYLFRKSRINYVSPLIYKNLLKLNDIIPPDILERFKTAYILQSLNNERRYQDLGELLKAFASEKIPVLINKGAALGEIVYGDIAFRPMSDIDLLVKPQDWPKITGILSDLGYTYPLDVEISAVPKESHIPCVNKNGTGLEFKFNLYWLNIPEFKNNEVWDNAIMARIAGQNTLIPSCEDHLLILSLGLLRHRYTGLIWFCDIYEFIRHYQGRIDWEKLIKKAKVKGVSAFLYYGLFLTDKMLGLSASASILKKLTPNPLKRKLFTHFHLLNNIISLSHRTEKKRSTPKSHLLQLFLIGKIGLNLKVALKNLLYFIQLALQSKKSAKKATP